MIMNRMAVSPVDWTDSLNGRLANRQIDSALKIINYSLLPM
jgi:hypothetical protein